MSPPQKRERGLFGTALNTAHLADDSTRCSHLNTVSERLPAGHVHFGKVRCLDCGRFIRWEPKPETIARYRLSGFKLARLAMNSQLNAWERNFVQSLLGHHKLSPRQAAIVERMAKQYLVERSSR